MELVDLLIVDVIVALVVIAMAIKYIKDSNEDRKGKK